MSSVSLLCYLAVEITWFSFGIFTKNYVPNAVFQKWKIYIVLFGI